MIVLIEGGSCSGKSEYAEQRALAFGNRNAYYAATMEAMDRESQRRVERHRRRREDANRGGANWVTIEQPRHIEELAGSISDWDSVVLLECMSNLVANEMYSEHEDEDSGSSCDWMACANAIVEGILEVAETVENLIVVTNNVFEDGVAAVPELREYLKVLGGVNEALAVRADEVIEVVVGIPVFHKGGTTDHGEVDSDSGCGETGYGSSCSAGGIEVDTDSDSSSGSAFRGAEMKESNPC